MHCTGHVEVTDFKDEHNNKIGVFGQILIVLFCNRKIGLYAILAKFEH